MDQSKEFEEILAWYDIVPTARHSGTEFVRRAIMIIDNASDVQLGGQASWHELLSAAKAGPARHAGMPVRTSRVWMHRELQEPGSINDETRPENGCASWSSS
jgi:hypothetical protein